MGEPMADPTELARTFVDELRDAVGDRLRAATLFGSAARGEWIEGVSDVNVMVLLDTLDAPLLATAAPPVRHAIEAGVVPLVMEMHEWRSAADVFTIELADMRDAHTALFGDDPVTGPTIQPALLRLQAERELRAKLLHLHGGMLVAADDPKRLGQLFALALPSFTTYMRATLRLAEQPVPQDSRAVIERTCELVEAEAGPFLEILDARAAGDAPQIKLTDPVADRFNTAATRLATYIDAFGR
jgi:predicted nucleotidyltransferase